MKKFKPEEIGYYGKPISSLTRDELLKAFVELAEVLYEFSKKDKKMEDYLFIDKQELDNK